MDPGKPKFPRRTGNEHLLREVPKPFSLSEERNVILSFVAVAQATGHGTGDTVVQHKCLVGELLSKNTNPPPDAGDLGFAVPNIGDSDHEILGVWSLAPLRDDQTMSRIHPEADALVLARKVQSNDDSRNRTERREPPGERVDELPILPIYGCAPVTLTWCCAAGQCGG